MSSYGVVFEIKMTNLNRSRERGVGFHFDQKDGDRTFLFYPKRLKRKFQVAFILCEDIKYFFFENKNFSRPVAARSKLPFKSSLAYLKKT